MTPATRIVILGASLKNYARVDNIIAALRQLALVKIIPTPTPDKPYRLTFIIHILKLLARSFTLDIPREVQYVVVLFPDNENVLVAALHRLLYRKKYQIIFDAFISLYDTYVYNKPLPLIRHPKPILTPLLKKWLYWYERHLFNLPDVLLCDTTRHGTYQAQLLRLKKRFETVLLVADEQLFRPTQLDNQSFWQQSPLRILWYGHLSDMHGMDYILAALYQLLPTGVQCTIIGNLPSSALARHSRQIHSGVLTYYSVRHPHYLPLSRIAQEVASHHISLGIFGSTAKAKNVIANKEVEALASARCLVTMAAPREYLQHQKNCIMVDSHNPLDMVKWLTTLASDRRLLHTIAKRGYEDYSRYASTSQLRARLQTILTRTSSAAKEFPPPSGHKQRSYV